MLKRPIILLVVGGTILLLAVSERRAGWLRQLRPAWGVPLMLAVVPPWCMEIGATAKVEFFGTSGGHSPLVKTASGQQAHGVTPGYYLAASLLTFWPGVLSATFAVTSVRKKRREPSVRFCLSWIATT